MDTCKGGASTGRDGELGLHRMAIAQCCGVCVCGGVDLVYIRCGDQYQAPSRGITSPSASTLVLNVRYSRAVSSEPGVAKTVGSCCMEATFSTTCFMRRYCVLRSSLTSLYVITIVFSTIAISHRYTQLSYLFIHTTVPEHLFSG